MTSSAGDDVVNEFTRRGFGELASSAKPPMPAAAAASKPSRALVPVVPNKPAPHEAAAPKPRKHTREQRLVLALARLLAARIR